MKKKSTAEKKPRAKSVKKPAAPKKSVKAAAAPRADKYYREDKGLVKAIAAVLTANKGKDVVAMDLGGKSPISNFFVVCTANSTTHAKGLADAVSMTLKKEHNFRALHIEGQETGRWIILDYLGVVVHIFSQQMRANYDLESLWKGELTAYED